MSKHSDDIKNVLQHENRLSEQLKNEYKEKKRNLHKSNLIHIKNMILSYECLLREGKLTNEERQDICYNLDMCKFMLTKRSINLKIDLNNILV